MSGAIGSPPRLSASAVVRAADGVVLDAHSVAPAAVPCAHVVMVHGLGEHSRALPFPSLNRFLADRGFAVHAFDLRGHGRSGGTPVYARDWTSLRADLELVVQMAREVAGGVPLFVLGGSLGGLIALDHAIEFPKGLGGVVAIAPALDASGASPLLRRILPLLARVVPRLPLNPGLDIAGIAHDLAVVQAYANGPGMRLEKMTPALAAAIVQGITHVHNSAARLAVPVLLLHGSDDRIVPVAGTRTFFERAAGSDKTLEVFEGAYHDLLLDDVAETVRMRIAGWIDERCAATSAKAPP